MNVAKSWDTGSIHRNDVHSYTETMKNQREKLRKKFLSHNAILTECYLLQSLLNHLEKESQGELQEFLTV